MSNAVTLDGVTASLHDELILEAGIVLRDALGRLDEARARGGRQRVDAARDDALALVFEAQQLLRRADRVALGVYGATW